MIMQMQNLGRDDLTVLFIVYIVLCLTVFKGQIEHLCDIKFSYLSLC